MNFRSQPFLRIPCTPVMRFVLLAVVGGSSVGCWQEVRYEPEKADPGGQPTDRSAQVSLPLEPGSQEPGEQIPVTRQAIQNPLPDSPLDKDSPDTTQTANSLTESSSPLRMTKTQTPSTEEPYPEEPYPEERGTEEQVTKEPNTAERSPEEQKTPIADSSPTRSAYTAWQLGSQWSLGAAIFAKGLPAERYEPHLERAVSAAHLLDLKFEPLPYKIINDDPVATIFTYLLDDQGSRLAEMLDQKHDARHAGLLQLAIRSHLLLLVYSPRNMEKGKGLLDKEQFQTWVDQLVALAGSSQLPESIWKPLLDQLQSLAPYADVKQAVFKLHKQVAAELTATN